MKVKSTARSGLFYTHRTIVRSTLAVMVAAASCGCSSTVSQETTSSITREAGYSIPDRKPAPRKQAVANKANKLVRSAYLGRAPYICTPSGFGSTSRCFLR
ncbi:hypothetical protein BMJ34_35135 [Sinorhizobium medicae]|uniref:Secreted protein n=1 Tax=Sinorhizobium medicae TaxID=110321 RepID=A0ABX4TKJ8_9HYPH|nr:hypothetical protein [Sinorhizobium medicae]MBO1961194.1 hypothetical protein [Sinorhizobium medicae]MDX0566328.1 hypothetical protein [Sinorhizobium medicae]MDX0578849.1 hypothetical protein [Sinorhizobium medicae]MDX0602659.1 hypothetical protein [Sinorhizobium medicae]MDX0697653.1 hypothetical protein [Sinorhizobium medicae]